MKMVYKITRSGGEMVLKALCQKVQSWKKRNRFNGRLPGGPAKYSTMLGNTSIHQPAIMC